MNFLSNVAKSILESWTPPGLTFHEEPSDESVSGVSSSVQAVSLNSNSSPTDPDVAQEEFKQPTGVVQGNTNSEFLTEYLTYSAAIWLKANSFYVV